MVQSLMGCSDGVILTIQCRILALKSLPLFLKTLRYVQESKQKPNLEGVLLNMVNTNDEEEMNMFREMKQVLPEDIFFKARIPYHDKYEAASLKALPVALVNDGLKFTRPWLDLAMELKEKERLTQTGDKDDDIEGLF